MLRALRSNGAGCSFACAPARLAAPGGYADEHIAHYTYAELMDIFTKRGFTFEESRYIMRGELIMAFRKASR